MTFSVSENHITDDLFFTPFETYPTRQRFNVTSTCDISSQLASQADTSRSSTNSVTAGFRADIVDCQLPSADIIPWLGWITSTDLTTVIRNVVDMSESIVEVTACTRLKKSTIMASACNLFL